MSNWLGNINTRLTTKDETSKINKLKRYKDERNWFFATNWNFVIPKSLQPDDANLRYYELAKKTG